MNFDTESIVSGKFVEDLAKVQSIHESISLLCKDGKFFEAAKLLRIDQKLALQYWRYFLDFSVLEKNAGTFEIYANFLKKEIPYFEPGEFYEKIKKRELVARFSLSKELSTLAICSNGGEFFMQRLDAGHKFAKSLQKFSSK